MIWATVSSQSCFADCIELSIFACKEYNQSDFGIDHLVMSMCRVLACVVGRWCLLWPVCSFGKTQLAFALLHFVLKAKFACYCRYLWTSYFSFHSPIMKRPFSFFLVLAGLVSRHRIVQLQLVQHYWLGHRLGLLWYWMVCFGNEQRSFFCFWDWTQVLHFGLFCWLWWLLHFF